MEQNPEQLFDTADYTDNSEFAERHNKARHFIDHIDEYKQALANGIVHGHLTEEEAFFALGKYCESESGTPHNEA